MTNPLQTALFRPMAPDERAGGKRPLELSSAEPVDLDALVEAAYDATQKDDPRHDDAFAAVPHEVFESHPVVGHLRDLDQALSDPDRVAEVLRHFAQGVADHHGHDLAELLGLAHPPSNDLRDGDLERALGGERPWWEAGFESPEAYEDAPAYERSGYSSDGEHRLAQRIDALQALLAPAIEAQRNAAHREHFEANVRHITPHVIDAVGGATGWHPTPDQVLHAARTHPHIAAQNVPQAVQAAFMNEILAAARGKSRDDRPRPDDMPLGGPRRGTRSYEPPSDGSVNWHALAESAYQAANH